MVCRNASSSGIQVQTDASGAVVSRLYRCGAGSQSRAGTVQRRRAIDAFLNLSQLTVVILTLDEAHALPTTLASLPQGANVLVLDARSRDTTAAIARAAGATVIERAWTDFVDARRFALAAVQTPWTFMLDADEVLDARLRDALAAASVDGVDGYRVRRATLFCGRIVRAFGWDDERLLRIFRTERATLGSRPVAGGSAALHERWSVTGTVRDLDGRLLHDSYPDRASYARKYASYTSLEAQGLRATPLTFAARALFVPLRFLWMLFARGGIRIGWRGAYLAFWSALYPALVHWKALRRGA